MPVTGCRDKKSMSRFTWFEHQFTSAIRIDPALPKQVILEGIAVVDPHPKVITGQPPHVISGAPIADR